VILIDFTALRQVLPQIRGYKPEEVAIGQSTSMVYRLVSPEMPRLFLKAADGQPMRSLIAVAPNKTLQRRCQSVWSLQRMSRRSVALISVGCLLLAVSAYSFFGVVQAASLFVGAKASKNANLWGSISLVAFLGSLICFRFTTKRRIVRSSMRRIVGAVAVIFALTLAWPVAAEFMAVDACLDRGGSYNYIRSACDLQQNHQHLPLFERQGFRIVGGLSFTALGVLLIAPSWFSFEGHRSAL